MQWKLNEKFNIFQKINAEVIFLILLTIAEINISHYIIIIKQRKITSIICRTISDTRYTSRKDF